jgi:hypothetical protein
MINAFLRKQLRKLNGEVELASDAYATGIGCGTGIGGTGSVMGVRGKAYIHIASQHIRRSLWREAGEPSQSRASSGFGVFMG